MKPHWLTQEECKALYFIKRDNALYIDTFGNWYHSDECWTDLYGPFETKEDACRALRDYCLTI